ncbi:MAG: hypothetical protein JO013_05475 [Alphaproteobacteria bacterium]|nr:hypothetical protein [Alphaproteobacteria bacterium]
MARTAEAIGMAGWVLVDALLEELDKSDPGLRRRVYEKAIADNQAQAVMSPGGNALDILQVLQSVRL